MKTIYKYPIEIEDRQFVELPKDSVVLSVGVIAARVYIWVIVDPDLKTMLVQFELRGTGHPLKLKENALFIGTFQLMGGALVYHLFKVSP